MKGNKFLPFKLKQIREIRGYTQTALAESIQKSKNSISLYEKGEIVPERGTIYSLSTVLKVSMDFFYTESDIAVESITPIYFRKLVSTNKTHRLMATRRTAWLAEIYDILSGYLTFPKNNLFTINSFGNYTNYNDDFIEQAAKEVRDLFKLGLNPIGNFINILEYNGVIIGRISIANTLDAFSVWLDINAEKRAFILLDQLKDSPVRLRFNCAHELGHLILHSNVSEDDLSDPKKLKVIEDQAHHFAGAFLLPKETFVNKIKSNLTIGDLLKLKKEWGVSIQAIILRADKLNLISEHQKKYLFKKINYMGYTKRDPIDDILSLESPNLIKEGIKKLQSSGINVIEIINKQLAFSLEDLSELAGIELSNLKELHNKDNTNLNNVVSLSFSRELKRN